MSIKCIFFGHKFNDWIYVKPIGRYEHKMKRVCKRCGKVETYEGTIKISDETGKTKPHKIK